MATYIPGVTDYIPQIQSFKPDLNFYSGVLQAKQNQYDQAHDKVSSLYSTWLNGPMLRDTNISRRDEFFKKVDQDIQKITKVDLSKQENITTAMSLLDPLTQDKYIAKDIAFTHNFQNEVKRADNFRTCIDPEKCGGSYWDEGMKALGYKAEEFKNAGDNESLAMSSPKFVPSVNVMDKAFKKAKEMGFNVTTVGKEGGYIVTHKNGQALTGPLYNYFISSFQNDPGVQEMYNTRAYVTRKDYAKQNAITFGSESAAEEQYLREKYDLIMKSSSNELNKSRTRAKVLDSKSAILENKINNSPNGVSEDDDMVKALQALQDEKLHNDNTTSHHEKTLDIINTTGHGKVDINTMRAKVDGAVSRYGFFADMQNAAITYSALNSEDKMEADPFALNAQQHRFALQREAIRQQFEANENVKKRVADYELAKQKGEIPDQSLRQSEYSAIESGATATSADKYDEHRDLTGSINSAWGTASSKQADYLKDVFNWYAQRAKTDPQGGTHYKEQISKIFGVKFDPSKHTSLESLGVNTSNPAQMVKAYQNASKYTQEDNSAKIMPDKDYLDWIPKKADIKKSVDVASSLTELKHNNDNELKNYLVAKSGGADRELWKLFFNPDGRPTTPSEFRQKVAGIDQSIVIQDPSVRGKVLSKTGTPYEAEVNSEKVTKVWNELYDKYKMNYQEGYKKGVDKAYQSDVPLIRSFRTTPGIAGFSEGLGARVMQGRADAADKSDPMFNDLVTALSPINDPNAVITVGVGGIQNDKNFSSAGSQDETGSKKAILSTFLNDMQSTRYKTTDTKRPLASFEYSGVAANDPNKVAVTVHINEGWAKEYEGSDNAPGITHDKELYKNGITVYMDKNKVMGNPFWNKNLNPGEYRTQLAVKPITVEEYPKAGSINISTNENGYSLEGYTKSFENGRETTIPIRATLPFNKDPEQFIPELKNKLKALQETNLFMEDAYKNHKGGNIKSADQLKK